MTRIEETPFGVPSVCLSSPATFYTTCMRAVGAPRVQTMTDHAFSDAERAAVYRAIAERRDMRHFRSDPVEPDVLTRLLQAAHQAPSVGLMQPWRIIRVTDAELRADIRQLVEQERLATAEALGERGDEFMRLKVEGMDQCAELLVIALMDQRDSHVFGRRTLPQMDLASVSCAIQNLWLAARAEGLGVGWVSIVKQRELQEALDIPSNIVPIAYLCVGYVSHFYKKPELESAGWLPRMPLEQLVHFDQWQNHRSAEEETLIDQIQQLQDFPKGF